MIKPVLALSVVLISLTASLSCKKISRKDIEKSQSAVQPSPSSDESAFDPVCCSPYASAGLRKAWGEFGQNGRFKVARAHSYEYSWGDLGYDFDGSFKHLAILVSDSMKANPDQYGVVIFSAPRGSNGSYKQYWLQGVQANANTQIVRASGYLFVDGCSVRWSRAKSKYVCG